MKTRICLAFAALAFFVWADDAAVSNAVAALQKGDLTSAEQILRADLKAHPSDGPALAVLSAVLDQEKKFSEAEDAYRKALTLLPKSAALLNNYGNHLLALGKKKEARAEFLKVEALEPGYPNATLQLASIALEQKQPQEADHYLSLLAPDELKRPEAEILRMQADYALHRKSGADALLDQLRAAASGNAAADFRLGVALSSVGEYEKAEASFAKVAAEQPDNTEAWHDLGLAASHAGHDEQARDALRQTLEREPKNAGVLYDLAAVDSRLNDKEAALELLVRARQIAPERADIDALLAHTAADLGYFGDAAKAWQAYMKLAPRDEAGAREHAFAETALGENANAAIGELQEYVRKHPADPAGHYELGIAQAATDQQKALQEIDRALELKPDLTAAHMARGLIYYRQGDALAALKDFQFAAEHDPRNARVLDRLGETDLALNRTDEAVRILQKAEEMAPANTTILLHLSRALARTGDQAGAQKTLARYRDLGGARSVRPHAAGLVDFLALSPEEQRERYRQGVVRTLENDPSNLDAQVRYLGLLLDDGKIEQARQTVRKIASLEPDASHLEDAAAELMNAGEYALTENLIEQSTAHATANIRIDLAVATLHVDGPEKARAALDATPASGRSADFYLAQSEILDAASQPQQAAEALQQAVRSTLTRPYLCREAALLFLSKDQVEQARALLDASLKTFPDDPALRLLRAFSIAISGGRDSEFHTLEQLWPDWPTLWMVEALALDIRGKKKESETAAQEALRLAPGNAALQWLAGNTANSSTREQLLASLEDLFSSPEKVP